MIHRLLIAWLAGAAPAMAAPTPLDPESSASEVGRERRFGVGVGLGFPPSGSVELFFDERNALALHVGPTLAFPGLHLRLQFGQSVKELRHWQVGGLWLTWQVGVVVELVFGQQAAGEAVRWGLHGGVGVMFRLVQAPVGLFVEAAPVFYPRELAAPGSTPFVPVQAIVVFGGRWYF